MPHWVKDTAAILAALAICLGAMAAYRWALSVAEDEMLPGDERVISVATATDPYIEGWADGYTAAESKYAYDPQDAMGAEGAYK